MKLRYKMCCLVGLSLSLYAAAPDQPGPLVDGTYDVCDFGAVPDDAGDDTAAIQACIDAVLGDGDPLTTVRSPRGPIHLPSGEYRISAPLRIYSAQYVNFHGDGGTSRLTPTGNMPAVLDLNGVAYSTFRDFLIQGSGSEQVNDAIILYYDPKTALRSTTRNTFEHIIVQDTRCVTALRVGKPGSGLQCDQGAYRDLTLTGSWHSGETTWWQHGLYIGDNVFANNLDHSAYNLASSFWSNGVTVACSNYGQWGGVFGQNGTDLNAQTLAYFTAQGFRSESSERLFTSFGSSSNDGLYSLSDIVWSADKMANDGEFVRMKAPGNLSIRNLQMTNGGLGGKILADSYYSSLINLEGVLSPNTLESFLSGVSQRSSANVFGYIQSNTSVGRIGKIRGSINPGDAMKWTADGLFFEDSGHLYSENGYLGWYPKDGKSTILARPK